MRVTDLMQHFPAARYRGFRPSHLGVVTVEGVTTDPASVRPGFIFVATPEGRIRNPFQAHAAARRGAAAVICEPREPRDVATPAIEVADILAAYDRVASLFHGEPASQLFHFLVTGGDYRIAAAHFLRQLIEAAGHRCALLGAHGCFLGGRELPTPVAELNAWEFHRLLAGHARLGGRVCIFESSPEMAQASLRGSVPARIRLGERPRNSSLFRIAGMTARGTQIQVATGLLRQTVATRVVGADNIAALAAAFEAALEGGADAQKMIQALPEISTAPGMLERVKAPGHSPVFVDSARTPEALGRVLRQLRPLVHGRLVLVAGVNPGLSLKDRTEFGRAAALADFIHFTADDPGDESVDALSRDACAAMRPGSFVVRPDRAAALRSALLTAGASDIILLAGKGYRRTQHIEGALIPWNETQIAHRILSLQRRIGASQSREDGEYTLKTRSNETVSREKTVTPAVGATLAIA